MEMIIQTCDLYKNVLEANKYMMDKFGLLDMSITVLGYSPPDFDLGRWKFVSMGSDEGPQNFTNDIAPFFNSITDDYFIYANDDIVLTEPFNHEFLQDILTFAKNTPTFGRAWLGEASPSFYGGATIVKDFGKYQLGEIQQSADYRLSLQFSLWKTSYFKKYLSSGLNPWQWELRNDAKNDGAMIVLPIRNSVVSFGHVMRKCQIIPTWYKSIYGNSCLSPDDIKKIELIFDKHGIRDISGTIVFDNEFGVKSIKYDSTGSSK
jgi:hypothetical protein